MSYYDNIKKDLDEAEFIILDEDNIKKYVLDPKDLYSFDKRTDDEKEIYSSSINSYELRKKSGGVQNVINKLTTTIIIPNSNDIRDMTEFIDRYSQLCIHIPFLFVDSKKYYIEYSAKKSNGTRSEKIIISISSDRYHKNELIHISCFPHSFIHLTFIINGKHYKIYQTSNPNCSNRFNDILEFIQKCIDSYNNLLAGNLDFWCDRRNNNWRQEVILNRAVNKGELYHNIMILLASLNYLINFDYFKRYFFVPP